MDEPTETPKQSKLVEGVKLSAVAGVAELALIVVGTAVLGAAYSMGVHFLALVIVVPVAFYVFHKWIRGRE